MVQFPDKKSLPLLGTAVCGKRLVALDDGPSKLKLRHHLLGERPERKRLLLREATAHPVQDADGAQGQPAWGLKQHHGIEAQLRSAGHERVAVEAAVLSSIQHNEETRLENGRRADRRLKRGLAQAEADLSLEPLSVL